MGRSSISFGSFKYLLSLMQTSPYPLWKASVSLTQDISFNHARHLHAQVPLPSAKVQHFKDHLRTYSELTEIIGLKPRKSAQRVDPFALDVDAVFLRQELHDVGREDPCIGLQPHGLQLFLIGFAPFP